jgi:hypothetical protein
MTLTTERKALVILIGVLVIVSIVGTIAVVAEYNRVSSRVNYTFVADEQSRTQGFVTFKPSNPQVSHEPVDKGGQVTFNVR